MIRIFELGTKDTRCPIILAMYVFPCLREIAAQTKRYFGLLIAFIIAT